MAVQRTRTFSLVSYLDNVQIFDVIRKHDNQIDKYAYLLHDKDYDKDGNLKQRHYHIIIRTVHANTVECVRNWFYGYKDANGLEINTLCQKCIDVKSAFEYLFHRDAKSREEGKTLYTEDTLMCNSMEYFLEHDSGKEDNLRSAFIEWMNGSNCYDLALKYGRDFIIHYRTLRELVEDSRYIYENKKEGVIK